MRSLSVVLLLLVAACGVEGQVIVDAGVYVDAPPVNEECAPLSCTKWGTMGCGTLQDSCGQTLECGACPRGYRCGAQDLKEFAPTPGVCGLGCRFVSAKGEHCSYPSLAEHACPDTPDFRVLLQSEEFWTRYACRPLGSENGEFFFCCGF